MPNKRKRKTSTSNKSRSRKVSSKRRSPKKSTHYFLPDGRMSGYEPQALKGQRVATGGLVHGKPAEGLDSARFSKKSKRIGKEGEKLFSRALKKDKLTYLVHSFWSVKVPNSKTFQRSAKNKADIDCVLLFADTLILVDVKYYSSGDGYYKTLNKGKELAFYDKRNNNQIGPPRVMSSNMERATEIFRKRFPEYRIYSFIVFMPTSKGEAELRDVTWPGGIETLYYSSFKRRLASLIRGAKTRKKDLEPKRSTITFLESLLSSAEIPTGEAIPRRAPKQPSKPLRNRV